MTSNALQVSGLSVTFGAKEILRSVTFSLSRGERLALVGESGAGKTTLCLALSGLLPSGACLSGEIEACGNRLAYLFQDALDYFSPLRRIGSQMEEAISVHFPADTPAERRRRLERSLKLAGLPLSSPWQRRYSHEVSGGERYRLMLATSLMTGAKILLADELTASLDGPMADEVLASLNHLRQEEGVSVLWVTHDLSRLSRFCDRVAVLYRGELVEIVDGAAWNTVRHPHSRALLEAVPGAD